MLQFVLASASPARRQLLQSIGINPLVYQSNFDESSVAIADHHELVQTLARCKAEVVANQLAAPALVLGCDSVLVLQGKIYGKPKDPADAIARWQSMRGQSGELLTGHTLIDLYQNKTLVRLEITQVDFAWISDRQIAAYVATGEPLNCAGAFALDGRGGLFVDRIVGCPSNVIGLSLPLLRKMLTALGYSPADCW
uniref:Nucleoside triphosphate pyrophosphatase n=1 Tax=Cyanothece sp. (strain PCC 7425 / ATCC 29141) TaxID=395961 RepID=NTPP_CYAP4|nr:RecName: Full=Nucleoside triphosphate pyrophosphatase; AltName: Full=Nucleotide pyrophosphatase; Short=Nucleotide PPase [Cyanothece sp. PCC 7425]